MAKLYFKYGAMGSSKTAQALITKYNYEENDMKVWLIKQSARSPHPQRTSMPVFRRVFRKIAMPSSWTNANS